MRGMFKKVKTSNKSPQYAKENKVARPISKSRRRESVKYTTTDTGKHYETDDSVKQKKAARPKSKGRRIEPVKNTTTDTGTYYESEMTDSTIQSRRYPRTDTYYTQSGYSDVGDQKIMDMRPYYNDYTSRRKYETAPITEERPYRVRWAEPERYQDFLSDSLSKCSDSECTVTEWRRSRSEADPSDYTDYGYRERRQRRGGVEPEYDDLPYARNKYDVYGASQPVGRRAGGRGWPETDSYEDEYDEESVTSGYTTGYGQRYEDQTEDSTVYDEEYGPRYDQAKNARDYGLTYKKQRNAMGDGRRYQVYAAHGMDDPGAGFNRQRRGKRGGEDSSREEEEKVVKSPKSIPKSQSDVVYLPVIVNGGDLPKETVVSPKLTARVEEPAEKPFENDLKVYAAANFEQGNVFENAAKEGDKGVGKQSAVKEDMGHNGNFMLYQDLNVYTSKEERNPQTDQNMPSSPTFTAEYKIDENDPSNPIIRKSYISLVPSILRTRPAVRKSGADEGRKSIKPETINEITSQSNAYETNNRKSGAGQLGRRSTKTTRQSMTEEPQNTDKRKGMKQTNSRESWPVEHIYPPVTRQSEARVKSMVKSTSSSASDIRKSKSEVKRGRNKGLGLSKNQSTTSLGKSGKGRESLESVARKKTMMSSLFRRKKTQSSEDRSHDDLEDSNRNEIIFTQSSAETNREIQQPLLIWGYDVSFLIPWFKVTKFILGLNIHDTIINVLKSFDE